MRASRREFLRGAVAAGAATAMAVSMSARMRAMAGACPFRLAVINDEISPDFDHACYVATHDFGLSWIELRSMWGTNVTELSGAQVEESKKILAKYNLKVTDIASPLFKTNWPGAPLSKESPKRDEFGAAKTVLAEQDVLLGHCIELAKSFGTDRIRCFDFWRLEDAKPYRAEMNQTLAKAADVCAKQGLILLLENEMACNTGTGEEAVEVLKAIPNPSFMLNWDPGNAGSFAGNVPYPNAYDKLPKERIGHCHCKNVKRLEGGKFEWQPVDVGVVDWVGQLKALKRDGYHYGLSLETHWRGAGMTAEASTRVSMKGLKDSLVKAGIEC